MSEAVTTITSREFIQDKGRAKREATKGPVFITTRGAVSHVLLTKEEFDRRELSYRGNGRTAETPRNLAEMLAHPEGVDIDFEVPEFKGVFEGFEFD